jgi:formiminotetrahydrofolate cyclodeaminase
MAVNCTYGDAFISEEEEEGARGGGACSSFSGVLSYCLLRI